MQRCYNSAVRMPKEPWLCCYGAPGCTAAPLSSSTSQSPGTAQSTGTAPKQESGSELKCKSLRLQLSSDASMQDLYLLLRAFSEGGWHVSVSVQATPSKESAPSPLDIAELFGYSMEECLQYELPMQLGALLTCLRSTTPSSKQSDWFEDEYGYKHGPIHIEPEPKKYSKEFLEWKKGCLGKLQEGRQ